MSAYLTREGLSLVAEDGSTLTVDAGDYLEAVDPFASSLSLRDRERWCSCLRQGAFAAPEVVEAVVLEVRGRYAYARMVDLLTVDE